MQKTLKKAMEKKLKIAQIYTSCANLNTFLSKTFAPLNKNYFLCTDF